MKKKVIADLIRAHYENDNGLFFDTALQVLKEFRETGDDVLAESLEHTLLSHCTIVPKPKQENASPVIYDEDAKKYFATWQVTD